MTKQASLSELEYAAKKKQSHPSGCAKAITPLTSIRTFDITTHGHRTLSTGQALNECELQAIQLLDIATSKLAAASDRKSR